VLNLSQGPVPGVCQLSADTVDRRALCLLSSLTFQKLYLLRSLVLPDPILPTPFPSFFFTIIPPRQLLLYQIHISSPQPILSTRSFLVIVALYSPSHLPLLSYLIQHLPSIVPVFLVMLPQCDLIYTLRSQGPSSFFLASRTRPPFLRSYTCGATPNTFFFFPER